MERGANCGDEPPMWGVIRRLGHFQRACPNGERFRVGHIESGANSARIQSIHERIGIDNWAARSVHQQRALLEKSKLARADEMTCLRSRWQDKDDDISLRKQAIEFADGLDWRIYNVACAQRAGAGR